MWDAAMAKDKVDAWLSSSKANEIEVIISNNDGMAMGALEAARAHGKQLPIFGVDALPEVLQLIKKGEIAGTVLNDGVNQGKAVVNLATTSLMENLPRKVPNGIKRSCCTHPLCRR